MATPSRSALERELRRAVVGKMASRSAKSTGARWLDHQDLERQDGATR
jgi:hypothetical protein